MEHNLDLPLKGGAYWNSNPFDAAKYLQEITFGITRNENLGVQTFQIYSYHGCICLACFQMQARFFG